MNIQDIALISFGGIRDRKFRFALNLLGILIGCAAVTGLISVTQGMNTEINSQLNILGANSINIIPTTGDDNSIAAGPQSMMIPIFLSWRDIDAIEAVLEIDMVAPIQNNFCSYTITGDKRITNIMGMGTNIFDINPSFEISEGRAFTRSDKAVAIIGADVAHPDNVAEPILGVGDRLKIIPLGTDEPKELTVRIIGITKDNGMSMSMSPDSMIMIPLRTSETLFENQGNYDMALASIPDMADIETVTAQIEDKIEDVKVISADSAREMIGDVTGTIEAVLGGIAAISLVVAGVGIVNTMTVSVSERTKEIGTLKAIGAQNLDVLFIFLAEAGYTGLAGGFLGGAFGFILGIVIGGFVGLPVDLNYNLWGMVILFAVTTSILAGAWPAWSAANMNPVEALRHE
ncbi:ABC transporter permease [Candidatus Bathyarchaeota archaeon]|nr:ABC transporter permease [Candidatus Bathyarchaeota archaeon]MBT4422921.1 ABC transporter permease [Candidatus Bathyarchaeota archaeon]MBT5641571.1 ABC transporter permease [Candidatus Bathyarchaeota archaeon]MBT6605842.1 ABC transporter permease [Candidatus Bathyarchaeota archaeon]MBT7187252.1 ABC transporter permease [Candidatus Bathyarchaeota archaeon]